MESVPYSLAKRGKTRCPSCDKKTFVQYIDNMSRLPINDAVGKCDRLIQCGYHFTPKQHRENGGVLPEIKPLSEVIKSKPVLIVDIPKEILKRTLQAYGSNSFINWLLTLIDEKTLSDTVSKYFIGSTKLDGEGTVFPYINACGNIRYCKVIQYGNDGHRIKGQYSTKSYVSSLYRYYKREGTPIPKWIENYQCQDAKINCLFGEHLLKTDTNKPIAIVESEKTAIIGSIYLPQFIWMALGSLGMLNVNRLQKLKGRSIVLFPDLNGYKIWSEKAEGITPLLPDTSIKVSSLLEDKASESDKANGLDLADYLTKYKLSEFKRLSTTSNRVNNQTPENSLVALRAVFEEVSSKVEKNTAAVIGSVKVKCLSTALVEIIDGYQLTIGGPLNEYWKDKIRDVYKLLGLEGYLS